MESCWWDLQYNDCVLFWRVRPLKIVSDVEAPVFGDLRSEKYLFIAITSRPTVIQSGSIS